MYGFKMSLTHLMFTKGSLLTGHRFKGPDQLAFQIPQQGSLRYMYVYTCVYVSLYTSGLIIFGKI